jgi:hypothetical protein
VQPAQQALLARQVQLVPQAQTALLQVRWATRVQLVQLELQVQLEQQALQVQIRL